MFSSGQTWTVTATEDRLLYSLTDGSLLVVARNGDPTPLGGTFNGMSPWPTINKESGGIFGAYTPGAQGGVLNAYFTLRSLRNCHYPAGAREDAGQQP